MAITKVNEIRCINCNRFIGVKINYKRTSRYLLVDDVVQIGDKGKILSFCNDRCYREYNKLVLIRRLRDEINILKKENSNFKLKLKKMEELSVLKRLEKKFILNNVKRIKNEFEVKESC